MSVKTVIGAVKAAGSAAADAFKSADGVADAAKSAERAAEGVKGATGVGDVASAAFESLKGAPGKAGDFLKTVGSIGSGSESLSDASKMLKGAKRTGLGALAVGTVLAPRAVGAAVSGVAGSAFDKTGQFVEGVITGNGTSEQASAAVAGATGGTTQQASLAESGTSGGLKGIVSNLFSGNTSDLISAALPVAAVAGGIALLAGGDGISSVIKKAGIAVAGIVAFAAAQQSGLLGKVGELVTGSSSKDTSQAQTVESTSEPVPEGSTALPSGTQQAGATSQTMSQPVRELADAPDAYDDVDLSASVGA